MSTVVLVSKCGLVTSPHIMLGFSIFFWSHQGFEIFCSSTLLGHAQVHTQQFLLVKDSGFQGLDSHHISTMSSLLNYVLSENNINGNIGELFFDWNCPSPIYQHSLIAAFVCVTT